MESLLSLSFDNISSRDSLKIRKGLRQIEGLLAQICLSKASTRSPHKRKSSALEDQQQQQHQQHQQGKAKALNELKHDPAFREFFRLQEGFQWNGEQDSMQDGTWDFLTERESVVASRLISTLECLMGMGNPSETDLLILACLELLQGALLLHAPSKCLFQRQIHMNLLLDLLDSSNPPKIQSQTLLVLVAALLDCPRNTRTFEAIDGLLTVTSLFKSRSTIKEVKMRALEFLYFYLMPETPVAPITSASAPNTAVVQRNVDKHFEARVGHARTHSGDAMDTDEDDGDTRSQEYKQTILGQYLSNVSELVADLQESAPFSAVSA
ncbi:Cell division control 14 [Lecanosticta acicola]|uniref:Cell division control 14 n=1 Tax=Lecanosticta acicola TaxID=111012 RepID=A0AAI9EDW3_9PEZI|nr:Cell division control 14 [Lecanosticta acicola]